MTTPVARRYAQALHAQAEQSGQVAAVDADIETIRATLAGSDDLRRLLGSPIVARGKKRSILHALFGAQIGKSSLAFLDLLVDKDREGDLAEIAEAYQAMRDRQQGVVVAQVRTAIELTPAEQSELKAALAGPAGGTVRLETRVEPDLIGGMVVRLGDTVYDGSVRHQLQQLRERFAAAPASTFN
jgi:F-type H+-transporting ATPase subunit delta